MNQTIFERWNRVSLRTKITGVTVLMLTLGLLVSGIGTAAMLRSYAEQQLESRLRTIASGDVVSRYFYGDAEDSSADGLDVRPSDDVFVAKYDPRRAASWRTTGRADRAPRCRCSPRNSASPRSTR